MGHAPTLFLCITSCFCLPWSLLRALPHSHCIRSSWKVLAPRPKGVIFHGYLRFQQHFLSTAAAPALVPRCLSVWRPRLCSLSCQTTLLWLPCHPPALSPQQHIPCMEIHWALSMLKSGLLRASNSLFSPDLHMTLLFCENCSVRLPFYLQSPPSNSDMNLWKTYGTLTYGLNLWKILSNGHHILCSLAHSLKMQFFVPGPILLSYSLFPLGQVPRRYSGSQTDRHPLVLPTSPAKVTPRDADGWGPSPACISVAIPTLCSFERLFLPSRCCMCPSPRVKLHPCSTGKISVLTPYAAHPSRLRDPNQCVLITNGETTFNSHPSSWVDVRRLLPSLQWVKAIK